MSFAGIIREPINHLTGATRAVFLCILVECNHADNPEFLFNNKPCPLKRGDWLASVKRIEELTGLSTKQVRTAIQKLKSLGILGAISKANRASLLTVENIDVFLVNSEKGANQKASQGQTEGKPRAINNKDNNKNNPPPIVPQGTEWVEGSLNEFYQYTPPEQFKEICIAAAEKKKVPTERAKREFEKFQTFWLDPSLSKAKAKKIDWKKAFQNWIGKIKFEPAKNNMEIAAEIHQNVMQSDIVKQCIAVGDPRLDSNLAFLKALNLGYTREQISKVIHQLCDNPPKNKIYSWSILNGYFAQRTKNS